MTDNTDAMAAQLAAVQQQLAALQGGGKPQQPGAAPAMSGWQQPQQPQGQLGIQGVLVPVKLQRQNGSVRVYLALGPESASSPDALHQALDQLETLGVPIDSWGGGQGGSGWNRGGGRGNGGWNNNRGGRW